MSYKHVFVTDAIGEKASRPFAERPNEVELAFEHMSIYLGALTAINETYLRRYLDRFPPLYQSGIVYGEPNIVVCSGVDDNWIDLVTLYELGRGTCKELAAARLAELHVRYKIVDCVQAVTVHESPVDGKDQFHAMVRWPESVNHARSCPCLLCTEGYPATVFWDEDLGMLLECPSTQLGMKQVVQGAA